MHATSSDVFDDFFPSYILHCWRSRPPLQARLYLHPNSKQYPGKAMEGEVYCDANLNEASIC